MKKDILSALACALALAVCIFFAGYGYKWLGHILWIPLLAFCYYAYNAFRRWRVWHDEEDTLGNEPAQADTSENTNARDDIKPDTKNIAFAALKRLGCSPKEIEEQRFFFTFQGFKFFLDFNTSYLARIALLPTPVCRKSDVVTFMELQEVLNYFNAHSNDSFFWIEMNDYDGEEGEIGVMIKDVLLLHPLLPHAEEYIAHRMECMIRENYDVFNRMESSRINNENGTKESTASQNAEN